MHHISKRKSLYPRVHPHIPTHLPRYFPSRIANVISASGQPVPAWILALPKPSKLKRRQLKKAPVERKSVGVVAGRGVGKGDAVKRREMVEGSKRRKVRAKDGEEIKEIGQKGTASMALDE